MLSFPSVAEAYRPDPPSPAGVNFFLTFLFRLLSAASGILSAYELGPAYQGIFGSSTDSDASFEGFSVTEMTKTKKASSAGSGKQPQKQSGAGFFPEQGPTELRAERATSQDGGDADGGPYRSTSGSDPALPPVHMVPR